MNPIDLHNHLLPGVDDGSATVGETLRHLETFAGDGVADVVLTPHLYVPTLSDGAIETTAAFHRRHFERLTERLRERPDLPRLHLGQEILAPRPEHLERALAAEPGLGLAGGPWLLVELGFGRGSAPLEVIDAARRAGRSILLAHVERYWFPRADRALDALARWRAAGARLQVNGGSLHGAYGPTAEALAWQAVGSGLVSIVATDHHGDVRPHAMGAVARLLARRAGAERARSLLVYEPGRILAGRGADAPESAVQPAAACGG